MRLVFLHGPAAAGKLTTARELAAVLHYPVFHNHLVVDLLTDLFPFGSLPFVRLREEFWLRVFEEAAGAARSLVFTFTPESTVPPGFPARVRSAVESRQGRVQFVRLTVSEAEQDRRIANADRLRFHKLADLETLRTIRRQPGQVEQPPVELEIDTESSSASQTARRIIDRFSLEPEPERSRYLDPTAR